MATHNLILGMRDRPAANRLKNSLSAGTHAIGIGPVKLMRCATFERYGVGQEIFREQQNADRFYLVVRGSVALETFAPGLGNMRIQTINAGDALGWSWLISPAYLAFHRAFHRAERGDCFGCSQPSRESGGEPGVRL